MCVTHRCKLVHICMIHVHAWGGLWVTHLSCTCNTQASHPHHDSSSTHATHQHHPGIVGALGACMLLGRAGGGPVDPAEALVDCKACAGKIAIPVDTNKVAHGDVNLALEDFLAKI